MKQNNWTTRCTQKPRAQGSKGDFDLTGGKCDWKRDRNCSTSRMRRRFAAVLSSISSETQGQSVGSGEKAGRKFSLRAKEPLGTDSHRTVSKNSSGCRLLIGHKKLFVLLCPIGEHISMSSFRVFVHDGYCLDHGLSSLCTKEMHVVRKPSVWHIKSPSDPTRLLCQMQANSSEPYQSSWREWIFLLLVYIRHKTWS